MQRIKDKLKLNRFIPSNHEELTALEIIYKLMFTSNDMMDELENKVDNGGDFTGSWHGISKPQFSEPGIAGVVDKNVTDIENLTVSKSIEMFGAVGDGKTDDTQAFKKAFETCRSVELADKTYIISDTLNVPSDMQIVGRGMNVTRIKMIDGLHKDMILVNGVSELTSIRELTLDHGNTLELSGSKISTIKLDDNTSAIHDEHYLMQNIFITGNADYGIYVTEQVREIRLNHVLVRGNNRVDCFRIEGTDNFINNCTAVGGKQNGFYIGRSNNKLVLCKSFYNDECGFKFYNCNMIQTTNCEAQENGRDGVLIENSNFSQHINLLCDTNGRNKDYDSRNIRIKNSNQNKIIAHCNQFSGLDGDVKTQIGLEGWGNQHNINITSSCDNKSDIIKSDNPLNMLSNHVISNGVEIRPYHYELNLLPKQSNVKIPTNCSSIEVDGGVNNDYTNIDTMRGYININGMTNTKIYTDYLPPVGTKLYYCMQGHVLNGTCEVTPFFYDDNGEYITNGEKISLSEYEVNRDSIVNNVINIPSNAKRVAMRIMSHNNGDFHQSFIKSVRWVTI